MERELEDEREVELEVLLRLRDLSNYWDDLGAYLESLDPEEAKYRLWQLENSMQKDVALALSALEKPVPVGDLGQLATRLGKYYPSEIKRIRDELEGFELVRRESAARRILLRLDVDLLEDDHGADLLRFLLETLGQHNGSGLQRLFRQLDRLESDSMADADEIVSRSWLHDELERRWPLALGSLGADERGWELEAILGSAGKAREHLIELIDEEIYRVRKRLGQHGRQEEDATLDRDITEDSIRSELVRGIRSSVRTAHPSLLPLLPRQKKLVGMDDTIDKLERYVDSALFSRVELAAVFPGSIPRGLILSGRTGVGKTESVRLVAYKLKERGRDIEVYLVPTTSFLASGLGESDKNIDRLFNEDLLDLLRRDSGLIVLFDELDGIARTRSQVSNPLDRILNLLFILLDQVDETEKLLFVGTTNRFELLDPAIVRRLGLTVIHIPPPDLKARRQIWEYFLSKLESKNLLMGLDYDRLSEISDGMSGGEIESVVCSCLLSHLESIKEGRPISQKELEQVVHAGRAD